MTDSKARLRDQRKPGHGWFDNEIFDVFGDELRQDGISVYMTMARMCYGVSVTMSLREMAGHARMSKDTFARSLKRVIAIGLVREEKGRTPQSASTYYLVDVKELAVAYMRAAVDAEKARVEENRGGVQATRESVSAGDSGRDMTLVGLLNSGRVMVIDEVTPHDAAACLTERQIVGDRTSVDIFLAADESATEVSQNDPHFATEVSQDVRHVRQDTRHKTRNNTPLPPLQGGSTIAISRVQEPQRQKLPGGLASACRKHGSHHDRPHDERDCLDCAQEAVSKVMRECGVSDPGVARVIRRAMELDHQRTDGPVSWNRLAEWMSEARIRLSNSAEFLFRVPTPKEFFGSDMWRNDAMWPWDKVALRETNQRRRRL